MRGVCPIHKVCLLGVPQLRQQDIFFFREKAITDILPKDLERFVGLDPLGTSQLQRLPLGM